MSLIWFNDNLKDIYVTLTPNHLTINKFGASFFETANKVLLGFDIDREVVIIKPLTKDDVIRGDIPESSLFNVSMNVSYARITNKSFLGVVNETFSLKLPKEGYKYKAEWNSKHKSLEVLLKERE